VAWSEAGQDVVLVRRETNPDDLAGMFAARGVLTSRGGKTSHAAVVARGMGRTCVVGADDLQVDGTLRIATSLTGHRIAEGDVIAIDGSTGEVFLGAVPVTPSPVAVALSDPAASGPSPNLDQDETELVSAVKALIAHADERRRLGVRANADTPEDAVRARAFGAEGIGLCRTEHMFLGSRRTLVERVILASDETTLSAALDDLLPLQRQDFLQILQSMDSLPVVIRLLDPPLHEFLPDLTRLSVRVAVAEAQGTPDVQEQALLHQVQRMHEENPMLGMRGVRLGLAVPHLFQLQVRAVAEASAQLILAGRDPRPEIMVPLVASSAELILVRRATEQTVAEVAAEYGVNLQIPIGTMIEVPRAALTADRIAEKADFFSFGTNDLTQMTWGFSRDDVEAAFFPLYLEQGIFAVSPFESLDVTGVGKLVELAVGAGRQVRPDLGLGVCGEHGGDPESIRFFDSVGLDYVSCSPFRVPVARLESGRSAVLLHRELSSSGIAR
jgi:pyruvate,orthophosphate dikinase